MIDWLAFGLALTAIILGSASLYSTAAMHFGWWPWSKWQTLMRKSSGATVVRLAKDYRIERDPGEPWHAFPWSVEHPHGGCVGVAMTRWGARRILRRATGGRLTDG